MGLLEKYLSQRRFFHSLVLNNVVLLNLYSFFHGLIFTSPLFILYLQENLSSTTEVSAVLSFQSLCHCLLELPSGLFADLHGRKNALIGCSTLRILSLAVVLFIHQYNDSFGSNEKFSLFLLSAGLEGSGQALNSGSDIALMYDSLIQEGKVDQFKSALATKAVMWPSGASLASFIGGWLGSVNASGIFLPLALTTFSSLISLLIAACLQEVNSCSTGKKRISDVILHRDSKLLVTSNKQLTSLDKGNKGNYSLIHSKSLPTWNQMKWKEEKDCIQEEKESMVDHSPSFSTPPEPISPETRNLLVSQPNNDNAVPKSHSIRSHVTAVYGELRQNNQLRALLISSFLLYSFSESTHRLRSVFYRAQGIPASYHGILGGLTFALSSVGAFNSTKFATKFGTKSTLLAAAVLTPLLQTLSSYSDTLTCSFLLLLVSFLFGVRGPLLSSLVHERVSPSCRSTIFSIQSLANKLSLSLCLPLIAGPITDSYGIQSCIRLFAFLTILPILWVHFSLEDDQSNSQTNSTQGKLKAH
jgi:MFS family permease